MTHKRKIIWKRNVDTPDKISWEHQKIGDEVFIVPEKFSNPKGSWEVYHPDLREGNRMFVTACRRRSSKKKALTLARNVMRKQR